MLNFTQSCSDTTSTILGVFDFSIAPSFLFYAYIPIAVISLLLGVFVLIKGEFALRSKLLFYISLIFILLLLNEIVQWIAAPVSLVLFAWELVPLLRILVPILTLYFVHVFVTKQDLSFSKKILVASPLILACALLSSTLNIEYFDIENCEGVPGVLWDFVHVAAAIAMAWIAVLTVHSWRNTQTKSDKTQNITVGTSAVLFLLIFFSTSIWGDITQIYDVALAGPVGMLLFVATLSYVIVRFNAFKIKLAAPIALVLGLWVLVFSLLFIRDIGNIQIIVAITLVLLLGLGTALIQTIRRETLQKEQIAHLAETLEKANGRLVILDQMKSEFVSIASHQLRSPLTSIRGYASMLVEGSYGKLPQRALQVAERIGESAKYMALSVEDYLSVSRIEAGNMKYEITEFNLRDVTEKIVDELRSAALKKGLVMVFRSDCDMGCIVSADVGKTRQIIMNLIDNSMKYTPKGTITVVAHDDPKKKKMYVTIEDTGVGMSKQTQTEVFEKFVRAKNANCVNVTGTGLGLYVAKKMITSMQGRVWAESEGEGKGSRFTIELPLVSGKLAKKAVTSPQDELPRSKRVGYSARE